MVQFVDLLVQIWRVQCAVEPVVPGILEDEEDGDLVQHFPDRGKGDACLQTEVLCHGVEEPDLG